MGLGKRLAVAFVVAGAAVAITACGSSSAPTTPTAAQNGFQAYADCLRTNGVTLPTGFGQRSPGAFPSDRPAGFPSRSPGATRGPGGGFGGGGFGGGFGDQAPAGVDQATWEKAQAACSSVRPTGRAGGGNNSAFVAYRNCLGEHGVTVTNARDELNTADPKVAAALKTCEPLRPSFGPGQGAPRPTPTS